MNHINADELLGFLDDPKHPQQDLQRAHLVECAECRTKLAQLKAMPSLLLTSQTIEAGEQALTDEDALLIAAYVEKTLDQTEHSRVQQRVQQNPHWQKAALHYLTHFDAMNKKLNRTAEQAIEPARKKDAQPKNLTSWFERLLASLEKWQAPVWQSVAATFIVTFAVGVFVINDTSGLNAVETKPQQLVQFQSDDGLFWQQPTPGLGFFHLANSERSPYSGVDIQLLENQLNIQWPTIAGVEQYQFRVTTSVQGVENTIIDQLTIDPNVSLAASFFSSDKAYQWVLSGVAKDGRQFQTSGGFVVSNTRAINSSSEEDL